MESFKALFHKYLAKSEAARGRAGGVSKAAATAAGFPPTPPVITTLSAAVGAGGAGGAELCASLPAAAAIAPPPDESAVVVGAEELGRPLRVPPHAHDTPKPAAPPPAVPAQRDAEEAAGQTGAAATGPAAADAGALAPHDLRAAVGATVVSGLSRSLDHARTPAASSSAPDGTRRGVGESGDVDNANAAPSQGIAEPTDESLSERGGGSGEQERWERAP